MSTIESSSANPETRKQAKWAVHFVLDVGDDRNAIAGKLAENLRSDDPRAGLPYVPLITVDPDVRSRLTLSFWQLPPMSQRDAALGCVHATKMLLHNGGFDDNPDFVTAMMQDTAQLSRPALSVVGEQPVDGVTRTVLTPWIDVTKEISEWLTPPPESHILGA